ncbi:MAG: DUF2310 family Zn-ribbon-containing protein [Methylococcales bacterium]|nr:DUF2310 family Zn-ribbon-containing protein [Methylococcales bacterium]
MYTFNIIIENSNPDYEEFVSDAYLLASTLDRPGQIVPRKHLISLKDNTITIPVICPEKNALDVKNGTMYYVKIIKKIEKNSGNKIEHILLGREAESLNYIIPKKSSFYILRNGWNFPLFCGDTGTEIPLYKIPKTDHNGEDYDNLYFWNKDYERLSGLWLSSGAYEQFAEEQMQYLWSDINKRGVELSILIEKLTGVPTYYFIHNYRPWSAEKDKQQKCPITGNDWLIEGKTTSDFIAFKCEESRLVSELSTNSSEDEEPLKRRHFDLNGKLLNFTLEAIDFRIKTYQEKMNDKNTSEDDYSDIANDSMVLETIKRYLEGE